MINEDSHGLNTGSDNSVLLTNAEVASILGLDDCRDDYDPTGRYIAEQLMSGEISFRYAEVEAIASHFGLTVEALAESDCRFDAWKNISH